MNYSLLCKADENVSFDSSAMYKFTYDLSLDRTVSEFCANKQKAEYFLGVLRRPLTNIENIKYRNAILTDFNNNPKMISELRQLFTHYDNIMSDWQSMKPSEYSGFGGNYSAMIEHSFSSLQVAVTYVKTVITYIKFIYETLSGFDIASEGLCSIREKCRAVIDSEGVKTVNEFADMFSAPTVDKYDFSLSVSFDETLRLACSEISSVKICERKKKNIFSSMLSKNKNDGENSVLLDNTAEDSILFAENLGIAGLYGTVNKIAEALYGMFYGLSKELVFYEVALLYEDFIKKSNMSYCTAFMKDCECDSVEIHGLKDVFLLGEIDDAMLIADNDVSIKGETSGFLIRGDNSSGKTSYIRAVGTAQIFAQAGLPICAEKAEISIRNGMFSHFSSAEKDFKEGDSAGRFEGEVQEISEIVNKVVPHSMILLNETFQTTVYGEGTKGIYGILKFMPNMKTQFFFVTRLTGLFDMLDRESVDFYETDEMYHINKIEK